jgi:hypothetical protein
VGDVPDRRLLGDRAGRAGDVDEAGVVEVGVRFDDHVDVAGQGVGVGVGDPLGDMFQMFRDVDVQITKSRARFRRDLSEKELAARYQGEMMT